MKLVPKRIKSIIAGAWDGATSGLTLKDGGFWNWWIGASNFTGESVTERSVLQISTAWACARLISESLASLPMSIYKQQKDGSKAEDKSHQLYFLLHTQPNAKMTAMTFWQCMIVSLLLAGNAYGRKNYSGKTVTSIDFLYPARVSYRRDLQTNTIIWSYADPWTGQTYDIPEEEMWHIPAFTVDGFLGLSAIAFGANVFGTSIAASKAASDTFKNGMKAAGLVTVDNVMKAEQREDVRKHVREVSATGGVYVLEKGFDYKQMQMNPQDAQLLETRKFSVEEICRWFQVPPWMVGHAEKSTSWGTGIEQQMLAFVTFVLQPWAVRIEQSVKKDLFSATDKLKYSASFALSAFLRGDSAARSEFYSKMTQNGIMTRDECRILEDRAPKGGNADVLTVQSNLLPIDKLGTVATTATTTTSQGPVP